jgi:ABC-type multidrug transport system fused ATPase/permease subunit
LWSAILYGTRVSLIIGICAVALQAFLGISIGLVAGYVGGRTDNLLMRVADIQLSFSTLMVAIIFLAVSQAVFGTETFNQYALFMLVAVIGVAEWPQYARTVRATVLAEKKKEYVDAARVLGFGPMRIMLRHILPNSISPIFVISTVQVANAIISEASLSFLGLGMPVSQPSLGSLISSGFDYIFSGSWWIGCVMCRTRNCIKDRPMSLLSVRDLSVAFAMRDQTVTALNGISFDLNRGERFGIVGESGAGKSITGFTILNLLSKPGFIARNCCWNYARATRFR